MKKAIAAVLVSVMMLTALPLSAQAAPAQLPLSTQLAAISAVPKGAVIRTYRGAQLTAEQQDRLNAAIRKIKKKKANVGFVVMNLQTGKMITYDPTRSFFSASTIKGPYVIALNRYRKKAWKKTHKLMKRAIIPSNNLAYTALFKRYGAGPIKSLYKYAGLKAKRFNKQYPNTSAGDLAKLWCGSYRYLQQNGKVPRKLRGYFARVKHSPINYCIGETTYSKPGWMEGSGRDIYNDAGIVLSANGPYVIAVTTSLDGDDHKPIRELVRVLHGIQSTM